MAKKLRIIRNGGMYGKKASVKKKTVFIISIATIIVAVLCAEYILLNELSFKDIFNKITAGSKTNSNDNNSDVLSGTSDSNSISSDDNSDTDNQTDDDKIPPLVYDSDAVGVFGDSEKKVYVFDNVAYEIFYGNDFSATNYSKTVNTMTARLKKVLGKETKFYSLVIPTRSEITLPDKQKIKAGTFSQKNNMKIISDNLDSDITFIDVYQTLMSHRDEYIFYNTDPVWTARGAYYGYEQFCRISQSTPLPLEQFTANTKKIEGYIGISGMTASANEEAYEGIKKNADSVEYYEIPIDHTVTITDKDGNTQTASLYYPSPSSRYAYAVFLFGGDCPVMNIKSENNTGKKLLVIKDNSANAMVPYLTCNYDEITVIDYRYFDGKIENLIKDKGINEVLFLNGIMDANTEIRNNSMSELLG